MKIKTHKATAKKIRVTKGKGKNKKYITRHAGQDHFNARESGNTTRNKRRNRRVKHVDERNIRLMLPYS